MGWVNEEMLDIMWCHDAARVPTVMENPGKSWKKKAVMEKSWKLKKINKVMETEKS